MMKADIYEPIVSTEEVLDQQRVFSFNSEDYHVTNRELEVLILLSHGYSAKEIGAELYLSAHTIISHKKSLIEKLSARNTVELVAKAVRSGLV